MPPYDSDSEEEEGAEEGYTETNVLLGYADEEPGDDVISYLGGSPTWLDPSNPPSASLAKCKVCSSFLVLLLQLNADLPERFPGKERRLYILGCRNKACRRKEGSVRALRGSRGFVGAGVSEREKESENGNKKVEVVEEKPRINIGETLFGTKGKEGGAVENPFSMGGSSGGAKENPFSTGASKASNPFSTPSSAPTQNPFAAKTTTPSNTTPPKSASSPDTTSLPQTFAKALSLNNPQSTYGPPPIPEPWPTDSKSYPTPYPKLYLVDADYEILDKQPLDKMEIPQVMDIDEGSGTGSGGGKEDKEVFESTIDRQFQKFADRVGYNPEQVLRYEYAGAPLLYSTTDAVGKLLSGGGNEKVKSAGGIPRCGGCGGKREFECQLTPHAIMELERNEEGLDGMEWGTILVGVCAGDCVASYVGKGEVGWMEEWVGVQWEDAGR
ncbi:hypothetical protein HYFRA_00005988 [Hymenoscyphus fraxineus]|uniref:Programmed cell death protein 2 C-terminal domain-containing protein n=1 Tax=Hymenoscyphus fraxineus TaxID=746836 RepID=A0A9N9KWZ7_9HELO|nr:hypothetical protein HYFRA_00005988 [Hymenoscyphus fraxineus]